MRRSLDALLDRHPWIIASAACLPCAFLGASGANHLAASRLLRSAPLTETAAPALPAADPPGHHVRDPERILARNVFDASAGSLDPRAARRPRAPLARARHPDGAPLALCPTRVALAGAVVADDPRRSFALVASGPDGPAFALHAGTRLATHTVTTVGFHPLHGAYVVLAPADGSAPCVVAQDRHALEPRAPRPADPPHAPRAAEPVTRPGTLAATIESTVTRAPSGEYVVPRALLAQVLENPAELARTTRVLPADASSGRTPGLRVYGSGPDWALSRLGVRSGDTLTHVNGLALDSSDRLLEAYWRMRNADHLTFAIERNGRPVTLDYQIR